MKQSHWKSIKEITDEYKYGDKKIMTETQTPIEPPKNTLPDIPTSWERFAVMIIFGGLAAYMGTTGNTEAMAAFATSLATYFLSRNGA